MMKQEERMVAAIRDLVRSEQRVSGSTIGYRLKQQFPEIDIREAYGGVTAFVARFCGDFLTFAGKSGLDHIFHVDGPNSSTTDRPKEAHAVRTPPPDTPWTAFSNPSSPSRISVNGAGEISVLPVVGEIGHGFLALEKLTVEDHRHIARTFLESIPDERRTEFENILQIPNYWPAWSKLIAEDKKTFNNWIRHRRKGILRLLRHRLNSLGLPDAAVERSLALVEGQNQLGHQRSATGKEQQLKEVLLEVLNNLESQELERIWVPIGPLLDALAKLNRE